jgi:hypothetical protein
MARHKDSDWNVAGEPDVPAATLCVLMYIRDELKALNRVIGCHNFIRIPGVLDAIAKNTKRRKYTRKPKG